jgi:HSP20 family protein
MSQQDASENDILQTNSFLDPFSPGIGKQNGLSLLPDDPLKDPFFNRPFDPNVWDPFQEMRSMHDRMNGMFGEAFGRFSQSPRFNTLFDASSFTPNIDIEDKGDHYVVKIDIPGSDNSNVDITCKDQQLTVSGKLDQMQEDRQGKSLLRQERRSGRFSRTVPLPEPVQIDKMETEFDKGIVVVKIPKADA